uniref:Uncharacterized protein n=1 Tax=Kalanchoe fedtschenkoi TaxID=63787 RepID=A0A7N0U445_KALFE
MLINSPTFSGGIQARSVSGYCDELPLLGLLRSALCTSRQQSCCNHLRHRACIGAFLSHSLFYMYGDNKQRKKMSVVLAVEAIIMAAIAAVTLTVFHTHAKRSNFVGAFCVAFAILIDKSVEYMPFWDTGFANGIVWVAYALLQCDLNILISNGTGAVLGAIQPLLWTYHRAIYPKCCARDARQTDIEMAVTEVQDQV